MKQEIEHDPHRFTYVIKMLEEKRTNINEKDVKEILIALGCHEALMDIMEQDIELLEDLIEERNEIIIELEKELEAKNG